MRENEMFKMFIAVPAGALAHSQQAVGGMKFVERCIALSISCYTTERQTAKRLGRKWLDLASAFPSACLNVKEYWHEIHFFLAKKAPHSIFLYSINIEGKYIEERRKSSMMCVMLVSPFFNKADFE